MESRAAFVELERYKYANKKPPKPCCQASLSATATIRTPPNAKINPVPHSKIKRIGLPRKGSITGGGGFPSVSARLFSIRGISKPAKAQTPARQLISSGIHRSSAGRR
jgi:hypothetical protein